MARTSINSTSEIEEVLQKTQIEWEKLNLETNERLYVLQRAHILYTEIEVLRKQIETTVQNVEIILNETTNSSNSFQQAKSHLKKLKVIPYIKTFLFIVLFEFLANSTGSTSKC